MQASRRASFVVVTLFAAGGGLGQAMALPIDWANSAGNSDFAAGPSWVGGIAPGVGDVAVFQDQAIVQQPTLAGPASVDGLSFNTTSGSWNLSGAGNLTVGSGGMSFLNTGASSRTSSIAPAITLGADQLWTVTRGAQSQTVDVNGKVTGAGNLSVLLDRTSGNQGARINFNNGTNDFSGNLIVDAAPAVREVAPERTHVATSATGAITPFGTGTLELRRGNVAVLPNANGATSINQNVQFGENGLAVLTLANRNNSSSIVWTGTFDRVENGGLFVAWGSGTGASAGGLLGDAGNAPRVFMTGQAITDMVDPYIIVSRSTPPGGGGALTGARLPTFAEYTANGLARVTTTGTIVSNDGTEHYAINDVSLAIAADLDVRSLRINATGTRTISKNGANDTITIRSGGLITNGHGQTIINTDLVFADDTDTPIEAVIWAMSGQNFNLAGTRIAGNITANGLTKLGTLVKLNDTGTDFTSLELAGNNSITGRIAVNDGAIRIVSAGAVADSNTLYSAVAGRFLLDVNETVAGLEGNGGFITSANTSGTFTRMLTVDVANGDVFSTAASLQDQNATRLFALTKDGLGTQILTGDSTHSGGTTINQGLLAVNGSLAGDVNVVGGTLGGSGVIGGTVTLNSGAVHAVGNSPGMQIVGAENWAGGSFFEVEINDFLGTAGGDPGWDKLFVNNLLDIQGVAGNETTVRLISLTASNMTGMALNFDATLGYELLIVDAEDISLVDPLGLSLDTSLFQNGLQGGSWAYDLRFNDEQRQELWLVFTPGQTGGPDTVAVPEPAAASLAMLGLMGIVMRRRRR